MCSICSLLTNSSTFFSSQKLNRQAVDTSCFLPVQESPTDPPLQSTSSAIAPSIVKTIPTGAKPGPFSPAKQQNGI
jgi:hypothetical protein